jgi:DNA-binding GntR family transcriptional regulator
MMSDAVSHTERDPLPLAARLRADITRGELRPDANLKVRELADRYGVSIIPVREALQHLHGEGLVVIVPNRGARVRNLDEAGVENVCGILEAMESYFSRRFAEISSPFQIRSLTEIEDEHERAIVAEDIAAMLTANVRFHDYINLASNNPFGQQVVERQRALLGTLRLHHGFGPAKLKALSQEHRSLIDAFLSRDADKAALIAGLHARSSKDDLIDRMRKAKRGTAG